MNTIFMYFYRDASNYKSETSITLKGEMTKSDMRRIMAACNNPSDLEFVPEGIGLPLERPYPGVYEPQDDHPWAYFYQDPDDNFYLTDKACGIKPMTVAEIVTLFESNKDNWNKLADEQTALHENDPDPNYDPDEEPDISGAVNNLTGGCQNV